MAKIINIKNEVLIRVYIVGFLIALIALIIMGQAVKIQVVEGDKWRKMRDSMLIEEIAVEAERGNIFASDGSILVTSLPFFDIRFDPTVASDEVFNANVDSLAHALATINTERTEGGWYEYLIERRAAGSQYLKIKDRVNYSELEKIKSFPIFNKGRFEGGCITEERFRRYRPFGALARRTLGRVDDERDIQIGLEGYFDDILAGESGKRLMYNLAGDGWIPVSDLTQIEPRKGEDIVTTLDVNIQDINAQSTIRRIELSSCRVWYGYRDGSENGSHKSHR